jgi:hypothetical protein
VSELVEQLRAQSGQLRNVAHTMILETEQQRVTRQRREAEWRSLADLIDGMIGRHLPEQAMLELTEQGAKTAGVVCEHDWEDWPCPDIRDIACHVSAVLSGYTQTAREGR